MVKGTVLIRVLATFEKVAVTRLSVPTLHAAHAGATASFLGSEQQEASAVPHLLTLFIQG